MGTTPLWGKGSHARAQLASSPCTIREDPLKQIGTARFPAQTLTWSHCYSVSQQWHFGGANRQTAALVKLLDGGRSSVWGGPGISQSPGGLLLRRNPARVSSEPGGDGEGREDGGAGTPGQVHTSASLLLLAQLPFCSGVCFFFKFSLCCYHLKK